MSALPRRPISRLRLGLSAWAAVAWLAPGVARAEPEVAVLYPEIGEPFRSVFQRILDGISERLGGALAARAVSSEAAPLLDELRRQRPRVLIALGRAGLRAAWALEPAPEVVASGIISPTEADARAAALLSLSPDPALLLARLRQLQPQVRRVTLVYAERHSAWLLRHAQEAAQQQGLELRALEAGELKAALRHYQSFLAGAGSQDALWLPQDPATVDEGTVLPLLLQECWDRNLLLFSSNLSHVRRGALFALYPDNLELGRHLGQTALALLGRAPRPPRAPQPLRAVHAALNIRTAGHLGLSLSPQLQRSFELLLPER